MCSVRSASWGVGMGFSTIIGVVRRDRQGRIALMSSPHLRVGPSDTIGFEYVWT